MQSKLRNPRTQVLRNAALLAAAAATLVGCAAAGPAPAENRRDLSLIRRQQSRADVERILGPSVDTIRRTDGKLVELYVVRIHVLGTRAEPPGAGRPRPCACYDLHARVSRVRERLIVIEYDDDNRVASIMIDRQRGGADALTEPIRLRMP